jgi:hypothetical protein
MRFLFIGSRFTLHASFPRSVALTQLRFTLLTVTQAFHCKWFSSESAKLSHKPNPWEMGVAHALANHRAQGALLQKPTHPGKQLGSDPN